MGRVRNTATLEAPVTLQQTRGFDASAREPDCGICLEEMLQTDATYIHMGCSNYFHSGCYERAIQDSLNCAKCREPIHSHNLLELLDGVEELGFAERVAPDMDAVVRGRIVLDNPENATPEQLLEFRQQSRPIIADARDEWDVDRTILDYWAKRRARLVELGQDAFDETPGYKAQEQYHRACYEAIRKYHSECQNECSGFSERTQDVNNHHIEPLLQQRYKAHYRIYTHVLGKRQANDDYENGVITEQERDRLVAEHEIGKLEARREYAEAREVITQMIMKDRTRYRRILHNGLRAHAVTLDEDLAVARYSMRDARSNDRFNSRWESYPPDPRGTGLVESREVLDLRGKYHHDGVAMITPQEEEAADGLPFGPTLGGILFEEPTVGDDSQDEGSGQDEGDTGNGGTAPGGTEASTFTAPA